MRIWRCLQHLLRRKQFEQDLEEEMRFHLAMKTEDQGEHAARRQFGNPALLKEHSREVWGWRWLESLAHDIRYGARMLRKSPAFTAVAVASLALGIGANTAVFSFVNAILLKTLPVPHPEQLVMIRQQTSQGLNSAFGYPFFRELEKRNDVFSGMLARVPVQVNLTASGSTERIQGELVSGNYFRVLGVDAALGRVLTPDDDGAAGTNPVCVISYRLWQERFGGDPQILGRPILLNAMPFQIVGVTRAGFQGPELQGNYLIQIPTSMSQPFNGITRDSSGWVWLQFLGRLKPDVSRQQAELRLDALASQVHTDERPNEKSTMRLFDASQGFAWRRTILQKPTLVLAAMVALVLLIACANLAGLLLARSTERRSEISVRLSLGATQGRLVRQFLVESIMLSALGGAAGLLVSFWMCDSLLYFLAGNRAGSSLEVQPDLTVLLFTAALSILTGLLFGSIPSWQSAHVGLLGQMQRGFRSRKRLRSVLIAAQIAMSLVLLVGAGLFGRTLRNLRTADLGFRPGHTILLTLNPGRSGYKQADSDALFETLLRRTRSLPQVESAALSDISPLSGRMFASDIQVPGHVSLGDHEPDSFFIHTSPGYFQTLGTPVLFGREFSEHDRKGTQTVAIVNERFVAFYWPGQNPVGRHFKWGGDTDVEIVGLARNSKYQEMREEPPITVYIPLAQRSKEELTLEARTTGATADIIAQVRQLVRSIDPKLPVYDVRTLDAQVDQALSTERLLAALSSFFSVVATFLAVIGLYGAIAYAVARRRREIGIRMAVGARAGDVVRLFVGESLVIVTAGIACGLVLAFVGARFLKTLLYGLQPDDSATLLVAAAVLLVVGSAAAIIPARRASRIDPSIALRYE